MMLCKGMILFLKGFFKLKLSIVEATHECCILLISDSNVQWLEIFNENGHLCRLKTLKDSI